MLTASRNALKNVFGGMPGYIRDMRKPPMVQEEAMPPLPGRAPAQLNADFDSLMGQLNPPKQPHSGGMKPPGGGLMQQAAAPQPSPVQGLMSQQFEKPKMKFGDKLGIIGGMMMDYDGTLGSGNADKARGMYDQRVEEARREFGLDQLGSMPGVTDQQRALLGMGYGAEQLAERAFATPAEAKDPFVVGGRVIDRNDPSRVIADYSDPVVPKFHQLTLADGEYEYIPGQPETLRKLGPSPVRSPLVSVNTGDGPQENAFMKEAGSLEAKNFGSLVEMGQTSRRNRVILDQLDSSAAAIPGGLEAVVKNELGNLGIPTDGLSEIQATEALINQLVPAQRQPGSGPMSDRDLALFKASLPRLIQTPEGKTRILNNMKAINDYVISEGEIGSRVLSGKISPDQGRAEMQALGNPLAGDPRTGAPTGPQGADLRGLMAPDGDPVTEDDVAETMRKYGVTREQVIAHLRGQ